MSNPYPFIDGINQESEGVWRSSTLSQVSYPLSGHEDLGRIEDQSFWFIHRRNCIVELAKTYSQNDEFFDIGGGNGFITLALQNLGYDSTLVEPGEEGVKRAKSRGVKKIIHGSYDDLNIRPSSLPHVGLFDVLEHIQRDLEFLNSLREKMSGESRLFVTVPAFNFLWSHADESAGHFRRYTLSDLRLKLRTAGFEIDYSSYFFSLLLPPLFLGRTIRKYLNVNQSEIEKDHLVNQGVKREVILNLLKWEVSMLRNNRAIPFGTSCIAVARKAK